MPKHALLIFPNDEWLIYRAIVPRRYFDADAADGA